MRSIIIYNGHDKSTRDWAVKNKSKVDLIFDWYNDIKSREIYELTGRPSPTGFPSVVYGDIIIRKPISIDDAIAQMYAKKRKRNESLVNNVVSRWYEYDGTFSNTNKITIAEIESAVPEKDRRGQFFVKDDNGRCHIVFCDPNGEYRFEKLTKAN